MHLAIAHSLPGRVRFRTSIRTLAGKDNAALSAALSGIAGVKGVSVNLKSGGILVHFDVQIASEQDMLSEVTQAIAQTPECESANTAADLSSVKKAAAAFQAGGGKTGETQEPSYLRYQLFRLLTPTFLRPLLTIIRAIPYIAAGLKSLGRRRLDISVLDAAAVSAAIARGDIRSASTLMMLLKTGEYLEAWAKHRSRENLADALSLNVGQVWLRSDDGEERQVPFAEVQSGDSIVLRSGALIPVDGKVLEGRAIVNEAALTGEPLGSEKSSGSTVHAGTVIEEGEIVAQVRGKGKDTRFQQIITLIEEGQNAKADVEIRANKIADKTVPFIFAASALTLFFTRNPIKASSVLSVDYSCAIKLATPLAFLAAIREGLQNGVFFKGGAPMEHFAACDTIVFDKTGTLTMSSPSLARLIPYNGFGETDALKIAACLEEHFPHPVAKAVVAKALALNVRHNEEHTTVKYIAAHGIASEYQGKHTIIGSRHFIGEDEGVDISVAEDDEQKAIHEGYSVLYLAQEKKLIAILLIKDAIRPEAAEVIAMLKALGVKRMYLLSGDNQNAASRIARELKLDGGRGGLLPQDKTAIVKNLREMGCRVAFVGDGMNDSPAMSAADVGIAMKDGAELALHASDITLKESSLYPLVVARIMSQRVMKRITWNTNAAIILNSIFILMGLLEKTPPPGTSGTSRSIWLHNLTSLFLSINAMRPLLSESK